MMTLVFFNGCTNQCKYNKKGKCMCDGAVIRKTVVFGDQAWDCNSFKKSTK